MTIRPVDVPPSVGAAASRRGWKIEGFEGSAGELHLMDVPAERLVRAHRAIRPAVVLGSTQPESVVRVIRAEEFGIDVARRRSGGGAVWLSPGHQLWVDVVVPAGDPLWHHDVGVAGYWLGEAWATLLGGARCGAEVRREPLSDRLLGGVACFAATGPGEVTVGGRKVVGVSQRRTRHLARFQCVAYLRWDPAPLLGLLDADAGTDLAAGVASALHDRTAAMPSRLFAGPSGAATAGSAVELEWGLVERLVDLLPSATALAD